MKKIILSTLLLSLTFGVYAQTNKIDYNKAYTGAPNPATSNPATPAPKQEAEVAKPHAHPQSNPSPLVADANLDYKKALCNKVQQCGLAKLLLDDNTPEFMQVVLTETVNAQCPAIVSSYETQIIQAQLEVEAEQCVLSLENKSCEALLQSKGEAITSQCNSFLEKADQAGIDFSQIQF